MKSKLTKGQMLKNSTGLMPWKPGMNITNSNGDIDSTSLGYQYTIQTTTQIRATIIRQKFYEVPPADFIPVLPGTGAWMEDIKTNIVYDVAGPFESGIQSTGSAQTQISNVDVATAPLTQKITTWWKGWTYSIAEVSKALASNNWDVVSAKMEALKRNWDLGIQAVAFLGLKNDLTNTPGLLTAPQVNSNTVIITQNISTMTPVQYGTLVAKILGAYFSNSNSTVLPDTFIIPMDDYLGLATPINPEFPLVNMLSYLVQAFQQITQNPNFQVKGLAYATAANNAGFVSTLGKQRYMLYRKDVETLCMDIPVEFFLTAPGTANNFNFNGVGAGQFTGTNFFRPAEALYFDHAA